MILMVDTAVACPVGKEYGTSPQCLNVGNVW